MFLSVTVRSAWHTEILMPCLSFLSSMFQNGSIYFFKMRIILKQQTKHARFSSLTVDTLFTISLCIQNTKSFEMKRDVKGNWQFKIEQKYFVSFLPSRTVSLLSSYIVSSQQFIMVLGKNKHFLFIHAQIPVTGYAYYPGLT